MMMGPAAATGGEPMAIHSEKSSHSGLPGMGMSAHRKDGWVDDRWAFDKFHVPT